MHLYLNCILVSGHEVLNLSYSIIMADDMKAVLRRFFVFRAVITLFSFYLFIFFFCIRLQNIITIRKCAHSTGVGVAFIFCAEQTGL